MRPATSSPANDTATATADAVRARLDWKYLLGLELTDPGFDASVLSEFRTRLIENEWEQKVLDKLLAVFRERGLLKARGQQRTDSTVVRGAVRDLNRLELVGGDDAARLEQPGGGGPGLAAGTQSTGLGGALWGTGTELPLADWASSM
jgi:hypothetical protein